MVSDPRRLLGAVVRPAVFLREGIGGGGGGILVPRISEGLKGGRRVGGSGGGGVVEGEEGLAGGGGFVDEGPELGVVEIAVGDGELRHCRGRHEDRGISQG